MVDVGFGYTPDAMLFKDINFGVSQDTRLAILGKNGSGKSTLLKLIMGELNATVCDVLLVGSAAVLRIARRDETTFLFLR